MTHPNLVQSSYNRNRKGYVMTEQKIEWITTRQAATILGVSGRQGVHYILNHLPEDAPEIRKRKIDLGNGASILQLAKSDIEQLSEYRKDN